MPELTEGFDRLAAVAARGWTVHFDEDYARVGDDPAGPTGRTLTLRKGEARIVIHPKIVPQPGVLGYTARLEPAPCAAATYDLDIDRLFAVDAANVRGERAFQAPPDVAVAREERLPTDPDQFPTGDAPRPEVFPSFAAAFEQIDALVEVAERWTLAGQAKRHAGPVSATHG